MHGIPCMGMLLVFGVVAALILAGALFVHALRADKGPRSHGWLVVVPLVIIFGWLLETLIIG